MVVIVLGGLAIGHEDDVIFLAALLHGRCIGDTGIVPAVHAGKIQPGLSQGLCQRGPAVRGHRGDGIDQGGFVRTDIGHDFTALGVGIVTMRRIKASNRIKAHQPEAHPSGVVDQIRDYLLGDFDAAF